MRWLLTSSMPHGHWAGLSGIDVAMTKLATSASWMEALSEKETLGLEVEDVWQVCHLPRRRTCVCRQVYMLRTAE